MTYASLLALLAALAFTLPLIAQLAGLAGAPRHVSIGVTLLLTAAGFLWVLLTRSKEGPSDEQMAQQKLDQISEQRHIRPHDPQAFFVNGEFQGDLLRKHGRNAEALAAIETYRLLAPLSEQEQQQLSRVSEQLRRELNVSSINEEA